MVLYNLIDSHIKCATLNKQPEVVSYLRLIKAEFMKYDTSKEAVSKPMDDVIELNLLKKMVKQRRESAEMYIAGNRPELAERKLQKLILLNNLYLNLLLRKKLQSMLMI